MRMETASGVSARRTYELSQSSHVSYLAQTRLSAPVILYSPECVYGASTAELELSLLGRCGVRELPPAKRPHPANRRSPSVCRPRTCGGHDSTLQALEHLKYSI